MNTDTDKGMTSNKEREPIPAGVTYDPESLVFFGPDQDDELPHSFFIKWIGRADEFPVHDYSAY